MLSFTRALITGLLAVGAMAVPPVYPGFNRPPGLPFDTYAFPDELVAAYRAADAAEAKSNSLGRRDERLIDLYLHVIQHPTKHEHDISDERLQEQVQVLNDAFKPHQFQFTLKNTTRTTNEAWFAPGRAVEGEMRWTLRQGGKDALNLFFFQLLNLSKKASPVVSSGENCVEYSNGTTTCTPITVSDTGPRITTQRLGDCLSPGTWLDNSWQLHWDGCNIDISALPHGSDHEFNMGKTAVHEVGHWLGLGHPFPDGPGYNQNPKICDLSVSDLVDDIPVCYLNWDLLGSDLCPQTEIDTCPDHEGKDPIHNYMHYTSDACRNEFTPKQAHRMEEIYSLYRSKSS
ncbi:pregnancy-associated plasma protein-A domain-containing protein [Hirsutella rhossiliensis]|uniref:Pregnancy-associated plasma protein-A domain-containing protein n=1 Tax=Hirsutella rhossiliensis TaxID=111463 RepID=A0A9P8SKR7_9HYPO|nr:pregnancy-associated plasma protein-A domain-containing protein [Hirsutella rhossiliensis]KAH0965509.1 pregnancy-associated plasma protein-A domain-containing protein [Hirsutella rhossiliensis]